jgi:hypothetical protein
VARIWRPWARPEKKEAALTVSTITLKSIRFGEPMFPRKISTERLKQIFIGIPLSQCRQCGEQYIPGKWAEKIREMMREEDRLVPQEIISVPVIALS